MRSTHTFYRCLLGLIFLLCSLQVGAVQNTDQTTTTVLLIKYIDERKRDLSGDGQIGIVNATLSNPLMLRAVDHNNNPVAGIKINHTILSQPEGLTTPLELVPLNKGLTDKNGVYRANCRLGDKEGQYELLFYTQPGIGISPAYITLRLTAKKPSWLNWVLIGVIGGLAIFLFGMRVAAEGMQAYAGVQMRKMLTSITKNPFAGLGMGTLITFLMQSSSASTSMLVSLVSTRMMSLQQALLLIPGAAIGTTLTVQLISFNILVYSLPLIAIGFFLSVISRKRRTTALGKMVMGFGLIFFGMKVMSETVIPLKSLPFFINAMTSLSGNRFWALIFSALFTIIIQSSGATLGIVIALAHQGVIDLRGAIPIIFGANVGTCITAILASMGTTQEAKRVAWAHFLYKLLGVVIFYPFINYLALLVEWLTRLLGMIPGLSDVSVARQVANADTLYNVIVALLFIPFVKQFEMLTRQFLPEKEEETQEVRPKYLDLQIMDSPVIAIGSVMREISRMGRFVQEQMKAAGKVIFERRESEIDFIIRRDDKVDQLHHSITCFLANLTQRNLSEDELEKSIGLLYIVTDLENIGDLIVKNLMPLGRKIIQNDLHFSAEGEAELKELYRQVEEDLARVVISCSIWDKKLALEVMEHRELLKHLGQELILKHLARLQQEREDSLQTSSVHLDIINYLLRLEFHLYHIASVVVGRVEFKLKEENLQHPQEPFVE